MRSAEVLWLTSSLTAISALLLDATLPAFGAMALDFRIDVRAIAAIVGHVVLTLSGLQLIVGPMSDRFGRKRVLLGSLTLASMGAVGSACATTYEIHFAFRIVQGAGCAGFALCQAILQDAFPSETGWRARIFTLTFAGVCLALAPLVGVALTQAAGWRAIFWSFAGLGALTGFVTAVRFPASMPQTNSGLAQYVRLYAQMLRHRQFMIYASQAAMAFVCHFSFIMLSPAIFIDDLGYSASAYGKMLAIYGLTYVAAGFAAGRMARVRDARDQIRTGFMLLAMAGGLMALLGVLIGIHVVTVLIPMLIVTFGASAVRPASTTLAMARFETHAGTAAAMIGAIRFTMAGTLTLVITAVDPPRLAILASLLITCSLTALLCAPRESCRSRARQS
ncbi:Bcr/CflA family drug resistance efflux transporter [Pandoraea sp. NE5]|uniref:MFS transporter n=1 Tax=Pandoraea sp. NE5 TaxID=2904129 RepID=UPI0021C29459|nr:MFS transporter [Pandoraea sp. NE5]BDD92036.1 Bcr/CflA family drug resistance efflux transporter [Pandoraea sp. NE5]